MYIYVYIVCIIVCIYICQIRWSIAQEILPSMFSRILSKAAMLSMALTKWARHIKGLIMCMSNGSKKFCSNNSVLPGVSGTLQTSSICQTRAAGLTESWKSSESWTSEAAFEKHPSLQQCRPGKVELFDCSCLHCVSQSLHWLIPMQTQ